MRTVAMTALLAVATLSTAGCVVNRPPEPADRVVVREPAPTTTYVTPPPTTTYVTPAPSYAPPPRSPSVTVTPY